MAVKKKDGGKTSGAQPRASITFPPELYKTLEDLAKEKKVSIAWVVRDAVEKYVADKWPLFSRTGGGVQP
jgi:metal-responsive CopG/Arc/MetJ family transcriptional regulator